MYEGNETKRYASESNAYSDDAIGRLTSKKEAPIQNKLDELEKAIMNLGERAQMFVSATECVRRITPTVETERGDVDKPHHSEMTHRLERFISIVNTYAFNLESARSELEL